MTQEEIRNTLEIPNYFVEEYVNIQHPFHEWEHHSYNKLDLAVLYKEFLEEFLCKSTLKEKK